MRLVTRGDLDGLTCSVLITTVEPVDEIELIHPQEMTDGKFQVLPGDIIANLPYHPDAGLWFDHHELTDSNLRPPVKFEGAYGIAKSTARLIHDHYAKRHGRELFLRYYELLEGTDRLDSATLTRDDIVNPEGVILLGYTIDSRTGLGSFREYFGFLVHQLCMKSVADVLKTPQVQKRVEKMRADNERFQEALLACSRQEGNVVITDFRPLAEIPTGNRFLIYTLFPDANVSVRLQWGPGKTRVMATVGHNILDRSSTSDVGHTMALFGGGGHRGAGSAPLPADDGDATLRRLIKELHAQG